MKTATLRVKLSKENDVVKHDVTPIEAMLLVAEHHRYVGGTPIDEATITDVKETKTVMTEDSATKKLVPKEVPDTRTVDQEMDRLKTIYHASKVNAILAQVRDMPTDFKSAIERGIKVAMPSGQKLSETKVI